VGDPALPKDPDDLLVARITAGDRDAFAELYRRHRSDVCRFAAHMSGSATLAEDIVHEAFVAVMGSASRYRPGVTTVKLWLLGIARNHVRRARTLRPTVPLPDDETNAHAAELTIETDPVGDIARRRDVGALRRAVVALPVRYREAVVLCDLHELSYADAAVAIGCAIGTIRSRLHRGRAMLAKQLCGGRAEHPCPFPAPRTLV
jgi:RNA polymerase sigma-70 factor (ECF subfamily)